MQITIHDMPITETKTLTGKKRNFVDQFECYRLLRKYPEAFVVMEQVSAMTWGNKRKKAPRAAGSEKKESGGAGAVQNFTLGMSAGRIDGVLAACSIEYGYSVLMVKPQEWKKEILSGSGKKTKADSLIRARGLFPQAGEMLRRQKDDGRAEALMLAEFGRRREPGKMAYIGIDPGVSGAIAIIQRDDGE